MNISHKKLRTLIKKTNLRGDSYFIFKNVNKRADEQTKFLFCKLGTNFRFFRKTNIYRLKIHAGFNKITKCNSVIVLFTQRFDFKTLINVPKKILTFIHKMVTINHFSLFNRKWQTYPQDLIYMLSVYKNGIFVLTSVFRTLINARA